jgi:nucleoside-diphosphate-sugar epimerase
MRILLTGGSGSVGQAVVERLVAGGHTVLVIGRRADVALAGAEYRQCDVNDYARLREVVRGCEAVVHLAAIPNPGQATPEEVFRVNTQGTFNVFQAAAEEGIRRVVQASSINAAGQFYGVRPAPLQYLPLDEDHPVSGSDAYSFSKHVIEEIGDYFWRREGITSLAYRLPWVAPAGIHTGIDQRREQILPLIENLLARPLEERQAWFAAAWEDYNAFRAGRPYEKRGSVREYILSLPEEARWKLLAMTNRVNFFTMLDERDSAQAVVKGLAAPVSGSHTLFINDRLNWTRIETRVLAELFYPDVQVFKKPLPGCESLVSIDRARALIGFEPEYSFGE